VLRPLQVAGLILETIRTIVSASDRSSKANPKVVQFLGFAWAQFSDKKVLNIRNFLSFFLFELKERFSKNAYS
jgi:hypothetical protein